MADTEMNFTDIFEAALATDDPLMTLHGALVQLRTQGIEKVVLLAGLETLRQSFRDQLDEENEDLVMDAMDFLVGWCSSHMRID
jgi:hypothetical protein